MSFLENLFFDKSRTSKKKIGILYICTGKYHIFWSKFYKSSQKFFCRASEVHYFIFTERFYKNFSKKNIHHINQSRLGWPFDTLKRFHLFLENKTELKKMDYLFFFNANMVFEKPINENEILPTINGTGLISVLHPYYYDHKHVAPFEDNPISIAYVNATSEFDYFQGCLSGGRTKEYLEMADSIKKMVDADLKNNIIGKWWDESYMNKYFMNVKPEKLNPGFAAPEALHLPFIRKIVQLDKLKWGGHDFLRAG